MTKHRTTKIKHRMKMVHIYVYIDINIPCKRMKLGEEGPELSHDDGNLNRK